jgi:16S rRNA (guanine527-N7)-methyltransferase
MNQGVPNVASLALAENLAAGVRELGLTPDPACLRRLLEYLRLLAKWNRVYNLTAIRDPWLMVPAHLLDSLAVLPYVAGPRLLDVGSGAGLPGLVLAIADPSLAVTLLDASGKKTRFLTQAVIEMKLGNVEVVQARMEDFGATGDSGQYNTVVSRAFSELGRLLELAAPVLAPGGRVLAMKATRAEEEARGAGPEWRVHAQPLSVPHLEATRQVLIAEREPSPGSG